MKKYISGNSAFAGIVAAVLIATAPLSANAADAYDSGNWEYSANVYMWMPKMTGETNSGVDFEIDFGTLLDNLKMTFMGGFEGRNGKWSLFSDLIYLNLGGSPSATVDGDGPFGLYRGRKVSIGLKSWIITLAGGYNYIDTEKGRLDIIRLISIRATERWFWRSLNHFLLLFGLKINQDRFLVDCRLLTIQVGPFVL